MKTKPVKNQMQLDGIESEQEALKQLGKEWPAKIKAEIFAENKTPLGAESRGTGQ
jgi:hypothetical protein